MGHPPLRLDKLRAPTIYRTYLSLVQINYANYARWINIAKWRLRSKKKKRRRKGKRKKETRTGAEDPREILQPIIYANQINIPARIS